MHVHKHANTHTLLHSLQFAATVEAQRREVVRAKVREWLERKHGRTLREHNLPRFLAEIGLPVRMRACVFIFLDLKCISFAFHLRSICTMYGKQSASTRLV